MSLKKHYSEKARLLNDKAVEKVANTEGNYIANNWYGEWETGGAVWFDYSLETGKWMEAYSKLVDGSPVNVEIQTVPLTDDTDLNEIEQLINAGLAYYTDNPHLCISISPKALNPDPFTPIATKFDFINLFPLEPENISIATPAKHAIDTDNEPQPANNNTADKPIDKSANTGATKTADDTDNATPKTTVKTANTNGDTAKSIDKPENTGATKTADDTDNATPKTADNEPKPTVTDSDPNSAKPASDNEPIDKSANTGTDNKPVNNSNGGTAKPTDNGSKADDITPVKTTNAEPTDTTPAPKTSTTGNTTPKTADNEPKPTVTDSDPNSAKPVDTMPKPATTDTDSTNTADKSTTTPTSTADNATPKPTDTNSNTKDKTGTAPTKPANTEPKASTTDDKPSTTNATPKTADNATPTDTDSNTADKNETAPIPVKPTDKTSTTSNTAPKATTTPADTNTGDKSENSTTGTTDNGTPKTTGTEPKTTTTSTDTDSPTTKNNVIPLDPPTITDVYQPVTPLYSQDGSLPTPPSNTIDQLLNVLMAQGVFSNDTVLSGTLQDFGVTTGGSTQWANAGNQQIGSGYMGQLWFTPFGQQTITDLSNNGYIWTDTTGTDYSDDDDALITFNSVTTKQSPMAGVMENTEWVKGTTWEQIPKTSISFKTLSADSLLCQMIQSGNVILWKKNVKPNGNDMIAALPTQTFTDYLGNKWTAPLAN